MKKVALKIAYIGTNFSGFQRQLNVITVEGELIKALKKKGIMEDPSQSDFSAAGRTDKGVHSLGNVVAFKTESEIRINQINQDLPPEIQIIAKAPVSSNFRPRNALKRYYRYILIDFLGMDVENMQKASKHLQGTHNFLNFSKKSERDPIRTVESIDIFKQGNLIIFDIVGESFLWKMVRKIIRVLYDCGKGDLKPEHIPEFFNPEIPQNIKPMPAECLILREVEYDNLNFKYDKYAVEQFISTIFDEFQKQFSQSIVKKNMLQSMEKII